MLKRLHMLIGCCGLLLAACDKSTEAPALRNRVTSAVNNEKFTIASRSPLVVSAGTRVEIEGTNFKRSMKLSLAGEAPLETQSIEVESETKAFFTAPDLPSFGPVNLLLTQDGETQEVGVFFNNGQLDHPIMTVEASEVCDGVTYYDAAGSLSEGTKDCGASTPASACESDGQVGCLTSDNIVAINKANIEAEDIVTGATILGIAGTAIPTPANCASDGEVGCVTTATLKAAATDGLASKVLSGQTVAGVSGNITLPEAQNVLTSIQYGVNGSSLSGQLTLPSAANVRVQNGNFGVAGSSTTPTLADCNTDGGLGCVTVTAFKAAKIANFSDADIRTGVTVAGVAGSLSGAPAACSTDAETGCMANASFKAADMSVAIAANIKAGVTIAGVSGDYPSSTNPLANASVTSDLVSLAATTAAATYEWWGPDGTRYTGTITDASTITPSASSQTFNTSVYRQFTVAGDADLVAGNIKDGVAIFGVTGDYPSATYPLAGADSTADLDLATFDAKIKSSSSFEWFDSAGTRYDNTGDADLVAANIADNITIFGTTGEVVGGVNCTADGQTGCIATSRYKSMDTDSSVIDAWDIRKGKTAGGIAGNLVFYKNMVASYNRTSGTGSHAGADIYDTVEDANSSGSLPTTTPTVSNGGAAVSYWSEAPGGNWIRDPQSDTGAGGGTASDGICNGSEACVYLDRATEIYWAKDDLTTRSWADTVTYCDGLSYGTYSDWRIPTQKELQQAHINGIWAHKDALALATNVYWSSTTYSSDTTKAMAAYLNRGRTVEGTATSLSSAICVRP